MELSLTQVELLQVAATRPHTLQLLPRGKKKMQKFVVGDHESVVSCFSVKKAEPVSVFRTMPLGGPITRVELGGVRPEKRKIFVATGSSVKAFTSKGKEFFRLETNVTEPIRCLFVEGSGIWTSGEYIYNQFQDGHDRYFFLCPDRINDLTCEFVSGASEPECILGCQDRTIRVLQKSDVFYEGRVGGPVTALANAPPRSADGRISSSGERMLLYGTGNGLVGCVALQPMKMSPVWSMDNERSAGAVTCLAPADLTQSGAEDVVVGRDDGTLEVLSIDPAERTARRVFTHQFPESVTNVAAGFVATPTFEELLVTSYSGRIVSFTTESTAAAAAGRTPDYTAHKTAQQRQKRLQALKQELSKLQERVEKERARVQRAAQEAPTASAAAAVVAAASLPPPALQHSLTQRPDSSYVLAVELDVPIDCVCVRADMRLDTDDAAEAAVIACRTPTADGSLCATYRCQTAQTRVEVRLRPVEGQYGQLQVYVLPQGSGRPCLPLAYTIRPLSQHVRMASEEEAAVGDRPLSELRVTGGFGLAELHAWVAVCLPDVPDKIPADEVSYVYRSAHLGSVMLCRLRKGEGLFRSDNVSALTLVKEVVSREATQRGTTVAVHLQLNEATVPHFLRLLHPLLEQQLRLARQAALLDSIQELKLHEPDLSFLSPELRAVADNAESLSRAVAQQPRRLEQLHMLVADFFLDVYKLRGVNARPRLPQLQAVLQNYSLDALLALFSQA